MKTTLADHERWMRAALQEAEKALQENEVPVGAVVVLDSKIIGKGHNRTEQLKDATAHAEMLAITAAANYLGDWRLNGARLYVTLEPCIMCAGAILNSRIGHVVFGAFDPKAGACGSRYQLLMDPRSPIRADITFGVMEEACQSLLQAFFYQKRREEVR